MTNDELNIKKLKEKYPALTYENMLKESKEWYREGLEQGKLEKETENEQLIYFLKKKIKQVNKEVKQLLEQENTKSLGKALDLYGNMMCYQEVLDFMRGDKNGTKF